MATWRRLHRHGGHHQHRPACGAHVQLHVHGRRCGQHTFGITLDTADTQSITVTDQSTSSLTATESNIDVMPGAAATLKVTGFPTSDTAGTAGSLTVTAYDTYGNVATGYTGTVDLSSTDPHAALPSSYTFTPGDEGQQTFGIAFDTAGTQSITVTDTATSSLSATESNITVTPAAAATLRSPAFPRATRRAQWER